MNTPDIITWLRDKLPYAPDHAWKTKMQEAATMLERLSNNLKAAVAQRNEYQDKYLAERERRAVLEAELKAEMHRHDRLQDFEVAEAEELRRLKGWQRWIPVTERLPKTGVDGTQVLTMDTRTNACDVWPIAVVLASPHWFTHWMPLPEPPKEEK